MGISEWIFVVMPTDHAWRTGRKVADYGVRPVAVQTLVPVLETKVKQFVGDLCRTPEKFLEHIQ